MADLAPMHEITPGLFVGSHEAATEQFPGAIICVLEYESGNRLQRSINYPVLVPRGTRVGGSLIELVASAESLDTIANIIDYWLKRGNVLVHCEQGIERSPLAVAWFLFRKRNYTFVEAYALVLNARRIAMNRQSWLDRHAHNIAIPETAYEEEEWTG